MRILLTNDDGYYAPGLAVLEAIAARFSDDVWVVAPSDEQSGAGHSLTLTRPLRVRRMGDRRFAVAGTPTDAVMMALARLMKDSPPGLILSGVNRGANLGEDVTYSGTVSAAMEGALAGVRSIALSQVRPNQMEGRGRIGDEVPFDAAAAWGERVLRPLLDVPMAPRTLVNVNFPALAADEVKGVRIVDQGFRDYGRLQIVTNRDPRGFDYHWFALGPTETTPAPGTDLDAVANGYVAVTPLHLDLTHAASLEGLRRTYG
ncbi:5'/3'-nucleotidase SurE [uncultured Sphingomonas sp.]|uniref:5'/3'-nucleotidase SurE n=1 Tax=uncultured Sphingomonas sp. TaxID=158754 RepID=UPI0035C9D4B4